MSEEIKNIIEETPSATETLVEVAPESAEPTAPKKKGPLGTIVAILAVVVLGFAGMCGIAIHDIAESGQVYDPNAVSQKASGADLSAGIAATVNGVPLGEADITAYVETVREGLGLTKAEDWAEWLEANLLTPEDVRSQSIDYFAQMELIRQAAAKQEVVVENEAIEQQLASIRAGFESEEAFQEALVSSGMTEKSLRQNFELQLMQEGIETKLTEAAPEAAKDTAASDWLMGFMNSAAVEVNPMPEGLPYDVATK